MKAQIYGSGILQEQQNLIKANFNSNAPHTLAEWTQHYKNMCWAGLVEDYQPSGNSVVDANVLETAALVYAARKAKKGLVVSQKDTAYLIKRYGIKENDKP